MADVIDSQSDTELTDEELELTVRALAEHPRLSLLSLNTIGTLARRARARSLAEGPPLHEVQPWFLVPLDRPLFVDARHGAQEKDYRLDFSTERQLIQKGQLLWSSGFSQEAKIDQGSDQRVATISRQGAIDVAETDPELRFALGYVQISILKKEQHVNGDNNDDVSLEVRLLKDIFGLPGLPESEVERIYYAGKTAMDVAQAFQSLRVELIHVALRKPELDAHRESIKNLLRIVAAEMADVWGHVAAVLDLDSQPPEVEIWGADADLVAAAPGSYETRIQRVIDANSGRGRPAYVLAIGDEQRLEDDPPHRRYLVRRSAPPLDTLFDGAATHIVLGPTLEPINYEFRSRPAPLKSGEQRPAVLRLPLTWLDIVGQDQEPPGSPLLSPVLRRAAGRWARHLLKKTVGLALSGGGASTYRLVYFLKELVEHRNVPIDLVAGISGGALLGAYFCADSRDGINRFLANDDDFARGLRSAVIHPRAISRFIDRDLGKLSLAELTTPFYGVAVRLEPATEPSPRVVDRGTLGEAVAASSSLPGLFGPADYGPSDPQVAKKRYLDGSAAMTVPAVKILENLGADHVISCNSIPGPLGQNFLEDYPGGDFFYRYVPFVARVIDSLTLVRFYMHVESRRSSEGALARVSYRSEAPPQFEMFNWSGGSELAEEAQDEGVAEASRVKMAWDEIVQDAGKGKGAL